MPELTLRKCRTCLGDGFVTETRADYDDDEAGVPIGVYAEQVVCWDCEGSGNATE